jgi:hypothetical protein
MASGPEIPQPTAPTATGGKPRPETASGTTPTTKTTAAGTTPQTPLYDTTSVQHHGDGSHTTTHVGSGGSVTYARPDFDGMMAGLQEHLGGSSGDED